MDMEAIILAGGASLRMKPQILEPKALLKIEGVTLLGHQVRWLAKNSFSNIVIACNEEVEEGFAQSLPDDQLKDYESIIKMSVEHEKLGTSGAVIQACRLTSEDRVYVMNVDDLLIGHEPAEMFATLTRGAMVAISKPRFPFGQVQIRGNLIFRFQEKPMLDMYTSVGHYLFKKAIINQYFPKEGGFEAQVLPVLAQKRLLENYRVKAGWITINNAKDYFEALEHLKKRPI